MLKNGINICKGILCGMVSGAILGAGFFYFMKDKKKMKKKAVKVMYAVGDLIEQIPSLFK
ncbi:MAG: hypothetical protein IJ758_02475 [Clostridia bacterium]|nr:hypothetical protein [Clostridia bacterium]